MKNDVLIYRIIDALSLPENQRVDINKTVLKATGTLHFQKIESLLALGLEDILIEKYKNAD